MREKGGAVALSVQITARTLARPCPSHSHATGGSEDGAGRPRWTRVASATLRGRERERGIDMVKAVMMLCNGDDEGGGVDLVVVVLAEEEGGRVDEEGGGEMMVLGGESGGGEGGGYEGGGGGGFCERWRWW